MGAYEVQRRAAFHFTEVGPDLRDSSSHRCQIRDPIADIRERQKVSEAVPAAITDGLRQFSANNGRSDLRDHRLEAGIQWLR